MRRNISFYLVALTLIFSLTSSSTALSKIIKGEFKRALPPPSGHSLVYIYRLKTQSGNLNLFVDGVKVSAIGNNQYTWFYANPGQHTIRTKGNMMTSVPGVEAIVNILPDMANYFRLQARATTFGMFSAKQRIETFAGIKAVPESQALSELAQLKKYNPAIVAKVGKQSVPKLSKTQKLRVDTFEYAVPPQPGYGLVYFYRPQSVSLAGSPRILVDEREYFKMKGDSYSWLYMRVGSHNIFAKWGLLNRHLNKHYIFNVTDGSVYFLRYGSVGGDSLVKIQFQSVESNLAKKEFLNLKSYVKPKSEYVE